MPSYIFAKGDYVMNKALSKIANDRRLALGVIGIGAALSLISNIIIFAGVYYTGVAKGVEVMTVEVDE